MRPRRLALIAALMISSLASAQTPTTFEAVWADVRTEYRRMMAENGMVGSNLMVVHEGDVIAAEPFGMADLAVERPVDAETIFHWASCTKTLTGIALLQLRDRGLLALDDAVVDYLPELKRVHNPYGPMEAITLRHLLTHSAGFRAPTWPWGGGENWHPHEPTTWDQLVAMLPYTQIHFEPGTKYSYSNPGIIFLGRIIEQLTGDDYEVYVDKNILKPLGMYASYFDVTPYHLLPHRSNNYTVREGAPHANGLDFDTGITVSNGGLNAPFTDMAKYLGFLMGADDDAERQATYDGVLLRASLEEMWTAVHPVAGRGAYQESVGLAFHLLERDGFAVAGHTGSQRAFQSFFYVDPATRTGVLAAFNTVGAGDEAPATRTLLFDLRERLFDDVLPVFGTGE